MKTREQYLKTQILVAIVVNLALNAVLAWFTSFSIPAIWEAASPELDGEIARAQRADVAGERSALCR